MPRKENLHLSRFIDCKGEDKAISMPNYAEKLVRAGETEACLLLMHVLITADISRVNSALQGGETATAVQSTTQEGDQEEIIEQLSVIRASQSALMETWEEEHYQDLTDVECRDMASLFSRVERRHLSTQT
jgi:hypothetical protein